MSIVTPLGVDGELEHAITSRSNSGVGVELCYHAHQIGWDTRDVCLGVAES